MSVMCYGTACHKVVVHGETICFYRIWNVKFALLDDRRWKNLPFLLVFCRHHFFMRLRTYTLGRMSCVRVCFCCCSTAAIASLRTNLHLAPAQWNNNRTTDGLCSLPPFAAASSILDFSFVECALLSSLCAKAGSCHRSAATLFDFNGAI